MVLETAVNRLRAGGTLCDLPAVSCPFHRGYRRGCCDGSSSISCCDDSSGPVVVATESVGGLSFLCVQYLATAVISVR